jgi:hypothetical protein
LQNRVYLPRAHADAELRRAGAAKVLKQKDHLVFLILVGAGRAWTPHFRRRAVPASFEVLDGFRQLGAASSASPAALENTGAQKLGDIL